MPKPRSVHTHLPLALLALAVAACECERQNFGNIPDAGPAPDAGTPDAGPPPPEFPLKPGDVVSYSFNITKCNETISAQCQEKSTAWAAEFTISEPGATVDPATQAYRVPAEYFWQVVDQTPAMGATEDPEFLTLTRLWLAGFGPWDQAKQSSDTVTGEHLTTRTLLLGGMPNTFPFLDLSKWDQAEAAFRDYVLSVDPAAKVETQEAARKFEAGYLEPSDNSLLHFVSLRYHPNGMLCDISEAIGPWDPTRQKNNSGFAGNQRDYQSSSNAPVRLQRAGSSDGPKSCKCGTQMFGSDCP